MEHSINLRLEMYVKPIVDALTNRDEPDFNKLGGLLDEWKSIMSDLHEYEGTLVNDMYTVSKSLNKSHLKSPESIRKFMRECPRDVLNSIFDLVTVMDDIADDNEDCEIESEIEKYINKVIEIDENAEYLRKLGVSPKTVKFDSLLRLAKLSADVMEDSVSINDLKSICSSNLARIISKAKDAENDELCQLNELINDDEDSVLYKSASIKSSCNKTEVSKEKCKDEQDEVEDEEEHKANSELVCRILGVIYYNCQNWEISSKGLSISIDERTEDAVLGEIKEIINSPIYSSYRLSNSLREILKKGKYNSYIRVLDAVISECSKYDNTY